MSDATEWITHVPVEVKPTLDHDTVLHAAGVLVWPDKVGPLSDRLYVKLHEALQAKAAADGVNAPVALTPGVWLIRCKRCQAPFIAMPWAKMCSDACRISARQDAALRSKAKRVERAWRERRSDERGRFVCAQCGKRRQALRRTRRFCSVKCRVAAHRGVPAQPPEPMTMAELDREIYDVRSLLGAAQCGYLDAATLERVMDRAYALQAERAERAKLDAPPQQ